MEYYDNSFIISSDFFTKIPALIYDSLYRLFIFFTKFDLTGNTQEFTYLNPFNGITDTIKFKTWGQGILFQPILNGIEKLFNVDLSVTPLELMLSSAIFLILAYAVIKFLLPLF